MSSSAKILSSIIHTLEEFMVFVKSAETLSVFFKLFDDILTVGHACPLAVLVPDPLEGESC